jgi:hypothetical protein
MKLFTRKELKLDAQAESEAIRCKETAAVNALKEKLTLLNSVDEQYKTKLEAKRTELGDAELKLRTFLANKQNEVLILEERRKQALAPIETDRQQLEEKKLQLETFILSLDEKQVEGIRSTGAPAHLRARFGVLLQVLPILASQILYNFESNTRSATVIGAIVGGGIGLLLTQAIQTQKDSQLLNTSRNINQHPIHFKPDKDNPTRTQPDPIQTR